MTDSNYTHVTMVVDRSGSMETVRSDAEGAVRRFIQEQQAVDTPCTFTLVEFDAPYNLGSTDERWKDSWYHTVHHGALKDCIRPYSLVPRGNTALFDAFGRAINETGEYLARMDEDKRPVNVVFVVQTDGLENSSREWTLATLRSKIKEQEEKYGWTFVFLGMGADTYKQGDALGIQYTTAAAQAPAAYAATYSNVSSNVSNLRSGQMVNSADWRVKVDDEGKIKARDEDDQTA